MLTCLSRLDSTFVPDECSSAPELSLSNACPSSEWEQIREYFALGRQSIPQVYQQTYSEDLYPHYLWLSGKNSQRQQFAAEDQSYDPHISPQSATTQMVAIADALTTTGDLWFLGLNNVSVRSEHGSPLSDQSDALHTLGGESYQGFSNGICVPELISDNDTQPVAFPLLYDSNDPNLANADITLVDGFTVPGIVYPGISRSEITTISGNTSQYRLRWLELPQPQFDGSSLGAVILPPVNEFSAPISSEMVVLCNLGAGWGTTVLSMHTSDSDDDTSVSSRVTAGNQEPNNVNSTVMPLTEDANDVISYDLPAYPQRPTNLTEDWARFLNPPVPNTNSNVFDLIIRDRIVVTGPKRATAFTASAGRALALLISNGMARVGFNSTLQGLPKSLPSHDNKTWIDGNYWLSGKGNVFATNESPQSRDWIQLEVVSSLQGYAYNTRTIPPRVAIAVLTLYCIIALGHTCYAGITGIRCYLVQISSHTF